MVVIEHNLDVIKCADWIIDLGPGWRERWGGSWPRNPESIAACADSVTGEYLAPLLRDAPSAARSA